MRTTLGLDDDVAALLQQIQKERNATLKQVINEALRSGLERMTQPTVPQKPFRTQPVNLGKCYFPNLDNTWEVLAKAEATRTNRTWDRRTTRLREAGSIRG